MEYVKRNYRVSISLSDPNKTYYNRYEDIREQGDGIRYVITGVVGEQWLATKETIDKTYRHIQDDIYETIPASQVYEAIEVKDGTKVKTMHGDILTAKHSMKVNLKGKPDNCWLVNKFIFLNTYVAVSK